MVELRLRAFPFLILWAQNLALSSFPSFALINPARVVSESASVIELNIAGGGWEQIHWQSPR
jgi:hypothetical protein